MLRPELVRAGEIMDARARRARMSVLSVTAQCQLLFWAWALGFTLGPAPLEGRELALGASLTFVLGAGLSFPFLRRRLDADAKEILRLREGGRRRRVALFDDYLMIGEEVVLFESVSRSELSGELWTLEYARAVDGQPTVRELSGSPKALSLARSVLAKEEAA